MRRAALVAFTLIVVALSSSYVDTTAARMPAAGASFPDLMLWAWERPTDLRDLDTRTGVAFFAQSILIADPHRGTDVSASADARPPDTSAAASAAAVTVTLRRNRLRVSPHTPLVAVTRLESPDAAASHVDEGGLGVMADAILRTASLPQVVAIQIDFDAVRSERHFYSRLLSRVREALPRATPLSITALASWCVGDDWLTGLPIDEAVPMLFRMGPINQPYSSIGERPADAVAECRGAIGTSLDEPLSVRRRGRRVYVFNSEPWSADAVARAREIAR